MPEGKTEEIKSQIIDEKKSNLAKKLEDKNKFSEEEVNRLKEIQQKYLSIQVGFGQSALARIKLENQITEIRKYSEQLRTEFDKNQEDEQNFIKDITEKYGEGSLDPKTFEFTPKK